MRDIAERLMAYEANGNRSSAIDNSLPALEKLRPHLHTLMGNPGVRGFLVRSLALASEEVRWLRAVHVKSNGSLTGLQELRTQLQPALFLEGGTVLLAQLIGLLFAFIGEDLTLRLVRDVWPTLSLKDVDSGEGDKNEKAK